MKPRSAWLEPRTLMIGLVVLAAAFTEGTANDWISVAFSEGYDLPRWAGVLGLAAFLSFMTAGRLLGTRLLDRYGRVPVLRVTFVMAAVGSLMVIFGGTVLAYVGAAIWGVGASLGFPVGMSASADDPARAAARMSVVATIGYTAFIAGPPAARLPRRPLHRAPLADGGHRHGRRSRCSSSRHPRASVRSSCGHARR